MKTIIINKEIEVAVARMNETEIDVPFRTLLLNTPADKQERISFLRSKAGMKGAIAKWNKNVNRCQSMTKLPTNTKRKRSKKKKRTRRR